MKKILLLIVLFFSCVSLSYSQDVWNTISYKYYSGPVSPEYQKSYTITINNDRTAFISYHFGMNKRAPSIDSFTVTKANFKKLNNAINKTGVLDGVKPSDSSDGKVGGPEKTITLNYSYSNPNADPPVKQSIFRMSSHSDKNAKKLFSLMDSMVPKKIWKKLEERNDGD